MGNAGCSKITWGFHFIPGAFRFTVSYPFSKKIKKAELYCFSVVLIHSLLNQFTSVFLRLREGKLYLESEDLDSNSNSPLLKQLVCWACLRAQGITLGLD